MKKSRFNQKELRKVINNMDELMDFTQFKRLFSYLSDKLVMEYFKTYKKNIEKICYLERAFRAKGIVNLQHRFTVCDLNTLASYVEIDLDIEAFYQVWKSNHEKYGLNYVINLYIRKSILNI